MSLLPVPLEVTPISLSGVNLAFVAAVGVIALIALVMAVVFRREVLAAGDGTPNMQSIARGVQEGASAYLGRPVGVKHVNAQINDDGYTFWKRVFPDTGLADPWGSYLHIDATYGMLKCAIYTHEIGPDGGPFCYIRGSQNAKIGCLPDATTDS